jgi:hypothetical protein
VNAVIRSIASILLLLTFLGIGTARWNIFTIFITSPTASAPAKTKSSPAETTRRSSRFSSEAPLKESEQKSAALVAQRDQLHAERDQLKTALSQWIAARCPAGCGDQTGK